MDSSGTGSAVRQGRHRYEPDRRSVVTASAAATGIRHEQHDRSGDEDRDNKARDHSAILDQVLKSDL